jgi:hypothetical protein
MEKSVAQSQMFADLARSETRAVSERHAITQRALLYVEAGLPTARVLDALLISRSTWHRRVQDLRAWQAGQV